MFKKKVHGLLLSSVAVISVAVAQDESGAPAGIKLAPGVRAVAQLDSEIAYTTNFFYRPDSDDEVSATGVVFRPSVSIDGDKGSFTYDFRLGGELSKWDVPGDDDDYEDTVATAGFKWDAGTRHRFRGRFTREDDHDPFGTVRTEAGGSLADRDIDKWHVNTTSLTYRFGAQSAKLNFEAGFANRDGEYDTNRDFTRLLDWSSDEIRAAAFYNISSKTTLVAEVVDSERTYDENIAGFRRDGEERSYRVGAQWKATGKTVGDVRVGRVEHDFEDPSGGDFDETDWQAGLTWAPRTQSRFTLSTGRESQVSYRPDTRFLDNEFLALAWGQDWSSLFRTTLTGSRVKSLFVDSDQFPGTLLTSEREDELDVLSLTGEYRLSPTVYVRGGLVRSQRSSNVDLSEYEVDYAFTGLRVVF